jgi:GST-like protein
MIDLYTWTTPNGRKISIALEEMELPYRAIPVDSPSAMIPAIVDGDMTLMESGAILLYLAQKSGKLAPPPGSERYWRMMEWLMWQMGNFGPILGQAHHFLKYNAGKSPYSEERFHTRAERLYSVLDKRLHGREFVADELTVADVAIWGWVSRFEWHEIDLHDYPEVMRWYLALAARPAFQRGYVQPLDVGPVPLP